MKIVYLFSSENGDVLIERDMLQRPFVVSPLETHPFLTLGNFFSEIKDFLLDGNGAQLKDLLGKKRREVQSLEKINRLIIRYEKYGILYHILSIDVESDDFSERFALSAAQFPDAKISLEREYDLYSRLNTRFGFDYLQEPYQKATISIKKGDGVETFLIMVSKWFEGYHEWHFIGNRDIAESVIIWDMEKGYRSISQEDIRKIIFEASKILTLYYDPVTFHRIYPWHHGAGDFIIKLNKDDLDVRLISVRGYEPIDQIVKREIFSPVDGIIFFLIEMTVKMRIDKKEGMGNPIWVGNFILPSVLGGFIEGIQVKEDGKNFPGLATKELLARLTGISRQEFHSLFMSYLDEYSKIDPVDSSVIRVHSEQHVADLYHAIKRL